MELETLNVTDLLRQFGLRPDKRLGQNFLVDESALLRIVEAAQIKPDETVLEIGPGLGSLTRRLALQAHRVVAVELDQTLIPPLQQVLSKHKNVEIIQGDILTLDIATLIGESNYRVVANIPYYITSALIRQLLEARLPPSCLVLTIQQEVAERICAGPGDLSILALSVQIYGHPQIVALIPAGAFYPPPQVDSAVVRIDRYLTPRLPPELLNIFFILVRAGFSQKRKKLRNALSGGLRCSPIEAEELLQSAGIDPQRRAETVSLEDWERLSQVAAHNPQPIAAVLPTSPRRG